MRIKGKKKLRAINQVATLAMQTITELESPKLELDPRDPRVLVPFETLYNLAAGYLLLYETLIRAKQMPGPANTKMSPEVLH